MPKVLQVVKNAGYVQMIKSPKTELNISRPSCELHLLNASAKLFTVLLRSEDQEMTPNDPFY